MHGGATAAGGLLGAGLLSWAGPPGMAAGGIIGSRLADNILPAASSLEKHCRKPWKNRAASPILVGDLRGHQVKQIIVARFSMIVLAGQLAGSCVLFAFLCRSFVPPIAFVPVGLLLLGIGMYWHHGKAIWIEGDRVFIATQRCCGPRPVL